MNEPTWKFPGCLPVGKWSTNAGFSISMLESISCRVGWMWKPVLFCLQIDLVPGVPNCGTGTFKNVNITNANQRKKYFKNGETTDNPNSMGICIYIDIMSGDWLQILFKNQSWFPNENKTSLKPPGSFCLPKGNYPCPDQKGFYERKWVLWPCANIGITPITKHVQKCGHHLVTNSSIRDHQQEKWIWITGWFAVWRIWHGQLGPRSSLPWKLHWP